MLRFIASATLTGILFVIMDGLINGNPYAVKLMQCYQPIAREGINIPLAVLIDLFYGFIISATFIFIMPVLPTKSGIIKGITFGLGMWFFRVVMSVISNWMMFTIPTETFIYLLVTGLVEMLILGILNGLILKNKNA